MTQSGSTGMGSKKHGSSGWKNGAGKSPKLRHQMKREAEQDERKPRPTTTNWKNSVKEVFDE